MMQGSRRSCWRCRRYCSQRSGTVAIPGLIRLQHWPIPEVDTVSSCHHRLRQATLGSRQSVRTFGNCWFAFCSEGRKGWQARAPSRDSAGCGCWHWWLTSTNRSQHGHDSKHQYPYSPASEHSWSPCGLRFSMPPSSLVCGIGYFRAFFASLANTAALRSIPV